MHSVSELKDGLSHLQDKDLIIRARETPTKLKKNLKKLLVKAQNMGIYLDEANNLKQKNPSNLGKMLIKKHSSKLKIALKYKEINFEADHILEREKLRNSLKTDVITQQKDIEEKEKAKQAEIERRLREEAESKLNYENFFKIGTNCGFLSRLSQTLLCAFFGRRR